MKLIVLGLLLLLTPSSFGENKKIMHVAYFSKMFGHIHKNPSRYSQSLSTLSCGHPVKVYSVTTKDGEKSFSQTTFNKDFRYVKVGPYWGYIKRKYLSTKKVVCLQDRYPRFFDNIDLKIEDFYYWGKLYDQYIYGKSRVK